MKIVTVHKSGGEYKPEHVEALRKRCEQHAPGVLFVCLNDDKLVHGWSGWWSKMEAFKQQGPVLYMDLSTFPTGNLSPLLKIARDYEFVVVRDFNEHQRKIQSCLMAWRGDVSYLYRLFAAGADRYMAQYTTPRWWGDQGFIEKHAQNWEYWQDLIPGAVASYKKHGMPQKAKAVCFHGKPKPWEVDVN